ncbi:fasciclin domain-containing protein [Mucilaginibacter paludis]|uniref:Beta-Ig-H3/fasciclin n=1 Tax=Mucilaginibacter paludis DSM 18603 TaxID=714943 RepID=H1Y0V6_9SPHI|nr:fasciclin domain-containing protein [Mucilaginibacter paludis]EHQ29181.1 beta-Ig-H3/fasciclin [Mucilaginibacter paludis DSM 18603]
MYKFIRNLFYLSVLLFAFTSCRKKAYDDFYGRPASLAPPIYQVLQARGNFTNLLACIDKAGMADQLKTAGYWTMFAPNDDAFKKYFALRGISGVAQIDAATATQIVSYSLVYNAAATDHISDYQSPTGYITNQAFKRRTSYHGGIYTDTVLFTAQGKTDPVGGQVINAVAANRNNGYQYGDFNNKYITYFTNAYLSTHGLSATDYNYFYPNTTYTGFNVVDGAVVNADISAENGIIHEINSVILPLKNLEKYLASNANYSHFKQIFDKYFVQYQQDVNVTHQYQVLTGKPGVAYVKTYFNATNPIGYSLNNENYLKVADNDGQAYGYTLFAPTNAQLDAYINSVILEHYSSLDKVPLNIIQDFLNAHMYTVPVWPTKFSATVNILGEPAKFDATKDVVDKYVGSNGFFYGVNKVQAPNVFSTVFGRPYLDPNYSLMTIALNSNLRYTIANPNFKFTIFMVSDATFRALGYDYSTANSAFTYTSAGVTTIGGTANTNFYRIINMLVASTPNNELNDLSGSGIFETGPGDGTGGEYLKYNANTIFGAGNVDAGQTVSVVSSVTTTNGKAYYTTGGFPLYSVLNVGQHIAKNATTTTSPFYNYYQYLLNSQLYTSATGAITGIQPGIFYTVLVPSNAAIQAAVNAGLLPYTLSGTTRVPNYKPTLQTDIDLVTKFIQYHIIKGTTIVTDGKKSSPPSYPTLLNDSNSGNPLYIQAFSSLGGGYLLDNQGRRSNIVPANSNVLSNYTVIHQIDNYLTYN